MRLKSFVSYKKRVLVQVLVLYWMVWVAGLLMQASQKRFFLVIDIGCGVFSRLQLGVRNLCELVKPL
jgi:hypothetical protein